MAVGVCIGGVLPGFGQNVEVILEDATIFGTPPRAVITAKLDIVRGIRRQSRTAEIFTEEDEDGARKIFAQIVEPPFLSNMRFLVLQNESGETERWIATSLGVRRVHGAGTNETLFNSDFTLEELSGFAGTGYEVEHGGTETVDGFTTDVVLGTVADPDSAYDSFTLRKDRATNIIVWIEFFSDGKLVKEYRLVEIGHQAGTAFTKKCRMTMGDGRTELTVESITFPNDIPDERFDESSLR